MSTLIRISLLVSVLVVVSACDAQSADPVTGPALGPGEAEAAVVFRNVQVLTMDEPGSKPAYSVLVRDGRIAAVGPSAEVEVPADARVIDGRGRWLMPGLVDGHVHVRSPDLEAYLVHGVTTVRNMWGWPGLRQLMAAVDAGEHVGPGIVSYSSGLDAPPEYWPYTQVVESPERAREVVREQVAQGWAGIKVYRDLSRSVFDAIMDEAGDAGVPVVGHVPVAVGLEHALDRGLLSIEHMLGYSLALGSGYGAWTSTFDEPGMRVLARRTRDAGAWNCPTLEILRRNGRPGHGNRLSALRVLHEEGAELIVGTDAGIGVTEPGASLIVEMELWEQAGIPTWEILRDATIDAARLLGLSGEIGVVRPGARADLLLLSADPLEGVGSLRELDGLMVRGRWYDRTN